VALADLTAELRLPQASQAWQKGLFEASEVKEISPI